MEMEPGKLFIGGISWDTSEERLKEYFQTFGEIVEAVIMKDRTTGRARGFGFIVFANASVAERVVRERHIIDGRTVEAKKAVPRDDHQNFNRNNGSIQGSPGPTRTKKIFVGGLASTVTESDFKRYFDQFGTITDVVVMYDHNTQRPRGFGFITYDSEEAVDKVLFKTFHELNGKMVEVKRAVPKELSPGPTRSQSGGFNYGRSGYPPYSPSNYNMGLNLDSGFGLNYGASGDSGLGYGRGMNSYYSGNTNRFSSPIGYDVTGSGPLGNTMNRNLWGNGSPNYGSNSMTSNGFSGTGNTGLVGDFGNIGKSGVLADYGRNSGGTAGTTSSYSVANNVRNGSLGNLYGTADVTPNNSVGYVGGYSVNARSNRGKNLGFHL
ncbi:hypothetical protein DH2020_041481 [Rehmannia glutinosa]|uniref:RRM domain-containing protein n=1 Tax=Rehmannia glutinosa TaxID=99300 RepID=A0ABR0UQ22_REHGL